MALQAVFKYRNLDSTADLNSRFKSLFKKGFFDGGEVIPVPLQLKVQIQPFKAMSFDGMIVFDSVSTQQTVTAGQLNYIVLKAIYQVNDVPTLEWEVLDSASYLGHPNFDNLILRCIVNVPALATATTTTMIEQKQADLLDKLGRPIIRGTLTSVSLLPLQDNRTGDTYIVTDGTGDQPNIFVYNGTQFINVTTASIVSNILTLHRQNLYPNEIHMTDDQAAAMIGTGGTPNGANPYVTSQDTRLPSQDENDAMGGIANSIYDPAVVLPATGNRYVTQSKLFAVGSERVFSQGSGGVITVDASIDGPIWVGTGSDDISAFQYFNIFNSDVNIDQEYVNSTGRAPKITNIYVGQSPLVPNSSQTYPPLGSQPSGFLYSGQIHFVLDGSLFRIFNDADVNVGTDEVMVAAHGLSSNRRVRLSTLGTLPAPLMPGVDYYLIVVNANTLQFSAVSGPGTPINIVSQGTGQFVIYDAIGTDTAFRFNYGRQFNLSNMPPDAMIRRKPSDGQKDAQIGITSKLQEFPITTTQDTINLDPFKFGMFADDAILDVNVYENGVRLMPNDNYFAPIVIVSGVNDKINFQDSTNTFYTVTVPAGTYSTIGQLQNLAFQLTTLMDTASADSIVVTYNPTTFKFTFTDNTGNFSLLWDTGINFQTSAARPLGFNQVDLTGAGAYTSDNMIERGYVGWYKASTTQIKLVKPARSGGNITVEKILSFNF